MRYDLRLVIPAAHDVASVEPKRNSAGLKEGINFNGYEVAAVVELTR